MWGRASDGETVFSSATREGRGRAKLVGPTGARCKGWRSKVDAGGEGNEGGEERTELVWLTSEFLRVVIFLVELTLPGPPGQGLARAVGRRGWLRLAAEGRRLDAPGSRPPGLAGCGAAASPPTRPARPSAYPPSSAPPGPRQHPDPPASFGPQGLEER